MFPTDHEDYGRALEQDERIMREKREEIAEELKKKGLDFRYDATAYMKIEEMFHEPLRRKER